MVVVENNFVNSSHASKSKKKKTVTRPTRLMQVAGDNAVESNA
jgi:hypothetical protein